jgi:hypothetical protein
VGRHSAREVFDEAKHPRGSHGKFTHLHTGRESTRQQLAVGNRSDSSVQLRDSAAARRAEKNKIRDAGDLVHGRREPRSKAEERAISPEVDFVVTGTRPNGARTGHHVARPATKHELHQTARRLGRSGDFRQETTGVRRTFSGKKIRIHDVVPKRGVHLTAIGRFNLAKFGR